MEGKDPQGISRDTYKGLFAPVRWVLSHPQGRTCIAQSLRDPVSMMLQHHLRQLRLILNYANPGEMHLQCVRTT
jgi:hypothetical protein